MGAISAALLSHLRSGDLVIAQYNVYGGTLEFLEHDLPRYGVTVLFEDVSNLARVEEILVDAGRLPPARELTPLKETPKTGPDLSNGDQEVGEKPAGASNQVDSGLETRSALSNGGLGQDAAVSKPRKVVIFAETVSNPLLVVTDVRALGALSKRAGAILVVDNTFGTPLRSRPLSEVGVLLCMSSMCKSGHRLSKLRKCALKSVSWREGLATSSIVNSQQVQLSDPKFVFKTEGLDRNLCKAVLAVL
jgi:hypothetical protein